MKGRGGDQKQFSWRHGSQSLAPHFTGEKKKKKMKKIKKMKKMKKKKKKTKLNPWHSQKCLFEELSDVNKCCAKILEKCRLAKSDT